MSCLDLAYYCIHQNAIQKLKNWLENFQNKVPETPDIAIIYGPPGSGKTTLVNSVLRHYQYDIVEFVPDHTHTHKMEIKRLENLLHGSNIMMMIQDCKKAIFFDDIDIGSSSDRGYISDIITIIDKKKKKAKQKNPLILTINSKISNKKTLAINKSSLVVYINRLTANEIFMIGKQILCKKEKQINDIELRLIATTCQGDIRNIYQKIEGFEHNNEKLQEVYSCKDLEVKCLPTLQKYANPKINVSIDQYYNLFFNDPLFVPAFIYENAYDILYKIKFKKKKKIISYYHKILDSLVQWCLLDSNFNTSFNHYQSNYNVFNGLITPMYYLRYNRSKYDWENHTLRTSNLYSRISQSSFNGRSLCQLSKQLSINKNEYHLLTYILFQLLISNIKENHRLVIQFFRDKNILSSDLDRLLRYNCLSTQIDKVYPNKKRGLIRKALS